MVSKGRLEEATALYSSGIGDPECSKNKTGGNQALGIQFIDAYLGQVAALPDLARIHGPPGDAIYAVPFGVLSEPTQKGVLKKDKPFLVCCAGFNTRLLQGDKSPRKDVLGAKMPNQSLTGALGGCNFHSWRGNEATSKLQWATDCTL